MIRQHNRAKKYSIIFLGIFEIVALIGSYAAHYFTKTRMGMVRHVIYLNAKWEESLPMNALKYIAIALIIVMIIFLFIRMKNDSSSGKISAFWTLILNVWTVYFLMFSNTEKNRAFYIMGICFIIAVVLQNIINCLYTSNK